MSTAPSFQSAEADRLQRRALLVGGVALAVCAVGAVFSPAQFFRAYLAAYEFYLGLGLGSFVVLMIYHLTGGAWGYVIRRVLEAGMRTIPLLAALFVPIAFGLTYLYLWARPEEVRISENLQHKQIYLNEPFFWARAALYFVLWMLFAYFLNALSRRQDQTGEPRVTAKLTRLSGPGLLIYGITITFASVDWIMSLQPRFRSTIFGPLVASGQLVSAHAFAVLIVAWLARRPPLNDILSLEVLNDLGNLLLTFLIIWAYMVFFQFMLIWIANLEHEVVWFIPRSRGGWLWVAWVLFLFHFAVPFFLLLMRDVKRDPAALAKVAGLILFMQLVFDYYQVMPAYPRTQLIEHWMDFLTPIGLGGLWLAYFLWQLQRSPLLPENDPNRARAVHLHQLDLEMAAWEREIDND